MHDLTGGRTSGHAARGRGPIRVLVVDDEAVLAEMVSMALRYEGGPPSPPVTVPRPGGGAGEPPGCRGARCDASRHERFGGAAHAP